MTNGEKEEMEINNYMKRLLIVLGLVFGLITVYGGPDKGHKKHRGKGNLHLSKLKPGRINGRVLKRNETTNAEMLRSAVLSIADLVGRLVK